METTVIISLITALAAIIAPVITAVVNNRTNLKLKRIEEHENRLKNIDLHEREILEKALSSIGIMMSYNDNDSIKDSCRSILTAVAYVDSGTGAGLMTIVRSVLDEKIKLSEDEYWDICNKLKKEILKRTNE